MTTFKAQMDQISLAGLAVEKIRMSSALSGVRDFKVGDIIKDIKYPQWGVVSEIQVEKIDIGGKQHDGMVKVKKWVDEKGQKIDEPAVFCFPDEIKKVSKIGDV